MQIDLERAERLLVECPGCGHARHTPRDCATFYASHPVKCMCDRDLPDPLLVALVARVRALTAAGDALAAELNRWGWGDFHYGSSGQERSVTEPIAAWRALVNQ